MKEFLRKLYFRLSPARRGIVQIEKMLGDLSDAERAGWGDISAAEEKMEKRLGEKLDSRITAILDHYGESWFNGRFVLELGGGYSDMGFVFSTLGAEITYAEGSPFRQSTDQLEKS